VFIVLQGIAFILLILSFFQYEWEYSHILFMVSAGTMFFSYAFGESVFLGFLKYFNADCIGMFSAGTGMAGLAGLACLLLFKGLGIFFGTMCICFFFAIIPFILSFSYLDERKISLIGSNSDLLSQFGIGKSDLTFLNQSMESIPGSLTERDSLLNYEIQTESDQNFGSPMPKQYAGQGVQSVG